MRQQGVLIAGLIVMRLETVRDSGIMTLSTPLGLIMLLRELSPPDPDRLRDIMRHSIAMRYAQVKSCVLCCVVSFGIVVQTSFFIRSCFLCRYVLL